jgi:hypothetical protein
MMPELEKQSAGQAPAAEQQPETPAGTPASPAAPEAGATGGESGGESGGDDTFAGLPAEFNWLKEKYQKRGTEAQQLRATLRETQEKLAKAKTPEEFAEVQTQTAELNRKLALSDAARKHKLSDEALELLDGIPADQIEARAEKLAKLAAPAQQETPPKKVTKVPLRGGSNPGEDADTEDGAALWRKYRASQ